MAPHPNGESARSCGGLPPLITFRPHPTGTERLRLDPADLPLRDRACLRVLARADAATIAQLTTLVYRRRRTAQEHVQRMWTVGLLERAPLAQHRPGTAPYAYRLARPARHALGLTTRRPPGPTQLRHTTDAVEVACALVGHGRRTGEIAVSAWLPESMLGGLDLGPGVVPDGLLVLDSPTGSGVLCLEIDEATEHAAVLRPRLAAYARALRHRPGWSLLVVVPSAARAAWMRRVAARLPSGQRPVDSWVTTLDVIERSGSDAPTMPIHIGDARPLRQMLRDGRPRATDAHVGSDAWLTLLGEGGGEQLDDLLR